MSKQMNILNINIPLHYAFVFDNLLRKVYYIYC